MTDNILFRLRKERGLTQQHLADKAGVHVKALAKLERGERSLANTRLVTALALADALQVDPHQFIEE